LPAGAGGLVGDGAGVLLGVDLPAEVDGQPDEDDHREAGGDQPDADRPPLPVSARWLLSGHWRSRNVSTGELAVAVTVRVPGTPGTARSARLTTQRTVAVTVAGVPTGAAKPAVSTVTAVLTQLTCWLVRDEVAAERAVAPASVAVRAMEAVRAAWVAAESTAWVAMATRPAKMMSPTNSRNAGSPIAASSAAEPRSGPPEGLRS
jgi:hypothetical protein